MCVTLLEGWWALVTSLVCERHCAFVRVGVTGLASVQGRRRVWVYGTADNRVEECELHECCIQMLCTCCVCLAMHSMRGVWLLMGQFARLSAQHATACCFDQVLSEKKPYLGKRRRAFRISSVWLPASCHDMPLAV
jgi:hypothetical protein